MISPQEIKNQALKWWKQFLQSQLTGEDFFPKTIGRIGKVSSSAVREKINELQTQLADLQDNSKEKLGFGYVINREDVNFRRTGTHSLPQSITFEAAEDYIDFIGKRKDWTAFLQSNNLINQELPQLREWVFINVLTVIDNHKIWSELIKVCKYFLSTPKPNLYLRQLPIDINTKFIENNEAVIKSLLDFLVPEHKRDDLEKSLVKRYYLKYDEATIRVRILDPNLSIGGFSDLRMPLSDFENLKINCTNIIITENKMNFLTLPSLSSTIGIWSGGGFMVSFLKKIKWLEKINIFYWGDLDVHGFLILHQIRSYYPQVKSIMMDKDTFDQFKNEGLTKGEAINAEELKNLTAIEKDMFLYLKKNNYRLEQEKIKQRYADELLVKQLT